MIEVTDPEHFEELKKTITRFIDFDSSQYSNSFLMRRIEMRLRANNLFSYRQYGSLISNNPKERQVLNTELTIHTTGFFRDFPMWEIFIEEVLPLVVKLKRENRSRLIRVWSAGSSTGEEALTIALCFAEVLGETSSLIVTILATDIDNDTLTRARQARYEESRFSEMPIKYRDKYFFKDNQGFYVPIRALKDRIAYERGDLHCEIKPDNMDIIFCRNVIIYFDKQSKSNLYDSLYKSLNSGGFLITGKSETLIGRSKDLFQPFNIRERIYCKE